MTLARDATLAACVLVVVALAGVVTDATLVPAAAVAGAIGALLLEVLASRRADAIQRRWMHWPVQAATVALALVAVASVAAVAPAVGLNALAGGLLAYLLLVALVAAGVVPPTTAWRTD